MEREPQARTRMDGEPLRERAPVVAPGTAPETRGERRRSVGRLFSAWVLWWSAVLIGWLWPEVPRIWRLMRPGEHGTFSLTVDAGLGELALWLALPPLLMTVVWLLFKRRRAS